MVMIPCIVCSGDGLVEQGRSCPTCNGKGEVESVFGMTEGHHIGMFNMTVELIDVMNDILDKVNDIKEKIDKL